MIDIREHGGSFGGGGGSNVKSIQRGTTELSNTSSINVAISSVDLSKSIVRIVGVVDSSIGVSGTPEQTEVYVNMTTSTNLYIRRQSSSNGIIVSWEVIEFNNVKSVQRGNLTLSTTNTTSVSISQVNLNKSMLFMSFSHSYNSTYKALTTGYFSNNTTLIFDTVPATAYVYWQVIEFN